MRPNGIEGAVDFGDDCRVVRRAAGKAGYCNYALNKIAGMRDVGAQLADGDLAVPPGTTVEVVKVAGDSVVTNEDITRLYDVYAEMAAPTDTNASLCVLEHVDRSAARSKPSSPSVVVVVVVVGRRRRSSLRRHHPFWP